MAWTDAPYGADLSMPRVGDDPVARGECRRRGGRMIDRPERPSSSVRPEPDSAKTKWRAGPSGSLC